MRSICTSIVALLVLAGTSLAATINVPGDYSTIQSAINASSHFDVIAIAAGTYYEHSLNPNGKAITIGSASGNLDVTIDANGGGCVFVFVSGEGDGTVGDGTVIKDLVITGGLNHNGGGIYCYNSNPSITNCTIEGNTADNSGGGIFCSHYSNPTITDCTISGNTTFFDGGGIYCYLSKPTIIDCTISNNHATHECGGGISISRSNPTIINCTISNNHATHRGGGISVNAPITWTSNPTIIDCTISGNTASVAKGSGGTSRGGGIFCGDPAWVLGIDSQICGNEPDQIDGDFWDYGGNTVADECPPTGVCCVSSGCVATGDLTSDEGCTARGGTWLGEDASCDDCGAATCAGDANADGVVDVFDLLKVIDSWGICD